MNPDFEIENGILKKYHGQGGAVVIPQGVTEIDISAFDSCKQLESVEIPDSVKVINQNAFSYCYHLKHITIPESVVFIGTRAFTGCESLEKIHLPERLTTLDENAFSSCTVLTEVNIPESITCLKNSLFLGCKALEKIIIPESVTHIKEYAFAHCQNLKEIIFPKYLEELGEQAFSNCYHLETVTIPEGVKVLETKLFVYCRRLKKVIIPSTVSSIKHDIFRMCDNLECISVSEQNATYASYDGVLYDKEMKKMLEIPRGKTSLSIPESMQYIEVYRFFSDTRLQHISVAEQNQAYTSIDDVLYNKQVESLLYCGKSKTSVEIPKTVTYIGLEAFCLCSKMKQIPLIIAEGKVIYRPKYRMRLSPSEVNQIVMNKDYSLTVAKSEEKYSLIFQMFINEIDIDGTSAYIKKNFAKMFRCLIENDEIEIIRKLLEFGKFISKRNIDKYIQYAIEKQKHEIQLMLTDYKQQKNWYQDIDTQIKNKFKL